MPIDLSKVNLDSPAFGSEAATIEPKENAIAQPPQGENGEGGEPKNLVIEPTSGGKNPVVNEDDEGQKVPYSRLQSVIEARREAEKRAEELEARLSELENSRQEHQPNNTQTPQAYQGQMPNYWVQLYGDSPESREAYGYELERQRQIRTEAREEALEAVRQERTQEGQVLSQNEGIIDTRLEDLELSLGRDITEKEETSILDIVDEYTPKDSNGNYAGDLMSFDKAWEIYELRQSQATSKTNRARQTPTALTGMRTESESVSKEKDNQEWNPLDWNSWRRRVSD